MKRDLFETWVQGYLQAWKTNERKDIEALFTEEATYLTQAFREPWKGRETIVSGWLERAAWQGKWDLQVGGDRRQCGRIGRRDHLSHAGYGLQQYLGD